MDFTITDVTPILGEEKLNYTLEVSDSLIGSSDTTINNALPKDVGAGSTMISKGANIIKRKSVDGTWGLVP